MVEFISKRNKQQISIVPNEWLLSEEKCVWPPYKSQGKNDEAVRCHQSPEENWPVFDIRILASAGTSIFLFISGSCCGMEYFLCCMARFVLATA